MVKKVKPNRIISYQSVFTVLDFDNPTINYGFTFLKPEINQIMIAGSDPIKKCQVRSVDELSKSIYIKMLEPEKRKTRG